MIIRRRINNRRRKIRRGIRGKKGIGRMIRIGRRKRRRRRRRIIRHIRIIIRMFVRRRIRFVGTNEVEGEEKDKQNN